MDPHSTEPRTCRVCGRALEPDHRYCPNCGTAAPSPVIPAPASIDVEAPTLSDAQSAPDPSTFETREFSTDDVPEPEFSGERTFEPTVSPGPVAVPPESGNRTLWIILAIVAAVVLICCCLLPLVLFAVASVDTSFQNDIRSMAFVAGI